MRPTRDAPVVLDAIRAVAVAAARSEGVTWLSQVLDEVSAGAPLSSLAARFVAAGRALGRAPAAPPAVDWPWPPWTADDAGRTAILVATAERRPRDLAALVDDVYRGGDSREKAVVVRALPLLPEAERFLELALDAGRTNELDLFTALACDNPYPAEHYPELEFDKLVMKAAFVGAPLERVVGLLRRSGPELARMGLDFIAEREAATRRFPASIWLAIAPHAPPGALARMVGYLHHADPEQRRGAARGLGLVADPRAAGFLTERLALEPDPTVADTIRTALSSTGVAP